MARKLLKISVLIQVNNGFYIYMAYNLNKINISKNRSPGFTTLKTLNKVNKNYTVLSTSLLLVQMYNNNLCNKTYTKLFAV